MDYKLVRRQGQKKLRMHLDKEGNLIVSCPYFVGNEQIEAFIEDNRFWIEEQRRKIENHSLSTGDRILYFGEQYDLVVTQSSKDYLQIFPGMFVVYSRQNESTYIKEVIKKQLKQELYVFSKERIAYWCKILNIDPPPQLEIGTATGKWGCCYKRKKLIRISLMTIALDRYIADMIILHEVCHLIYANHADEFWNLMSALMPDIEERKKILKKVTQNIDFRNFYS